MKAAKGKTRGFKKWTVILACGLYRILEPKHLPRYVCARLCAPARRSENVSPWKIALIVDKFISRIYRLSVVATTSDSASIEIFVVSKKKEESVTSRSDLSSPETLGNFRVRQRRGREFGFNLMSNKQ